jgi:hypothetical protein
MDTTIGTGQTSVSFISTTSDATNKDFYVARWVSPELDQTSIAANTWTWNYAVKASNVSNPGVEDYPGNTTDDRVPMNCYVWRPSDGTKVGTIRDGLTNDEYYDVGWNTNQVATTSESAEHGTFTGSSVAGVQTGDVIIFEAWCTVDTNTSNSLTLNWYFDGTTVTTTDGPTVSNHASFLETPENLTFAVVTSTATRPYHSFSDRGFWPAVGARTF